MQKKILITGSNGLLGQKIVDLLSDRIGVSIMGLGQGANRHLLQESFSYRSLDITDAVAMKKVFDDFAPDAVIHTAAMTQVDDCEVDRERCDRINYEAVKFLADLCKDGGAQLVHVSTDFIFDGEEGPYAEGATPNPVNYYGQSKLRAEQAILESGVEYAILRTILLYGMTPAMSRSNIVLWAKQSLEAGKEITVVTDQFRSPTLAEDLANACVSAVMLDARGIYHISGPEHMSIFELVQRVAKFWKLNEELIIPIESKTLKQKAPRPPRTGFIILKAQTEINYRPRPLEQGLSMVDLQMKEGWGY